MEIIFAELPYQAIDLFAGCGILSANIKSLFFVGKYNLSDSLPFTEYVFWFEQLLSYFKPNKLVKDVPMA